MLEELKTIISEREDGKEILEGLLRDGLMKVDIKGGRNRLFGGP
jgi:hypothetical protein